MGKITNSVMTEREVRLLWMGLKSLQEFGLPDSVAMHCKDEEIEELLVAVTKACCQYLNTSGPPSDAELKQRVERGLHKSRIRMNSSEYKAKVAKMHKDLEAKWKREKFEAELKRRRETQFTQGLDSRTYAMTKDKFRSEQSQKAIDEIFKRRDDWQKELEAWRKKRRK